MILNCGPDANTRRISRFDRLRNWHPFFALWPRRVGPQQCAWLQTIQRKGEIHSGYAGCYWVWEYKL